MKKSTIFWIVVFAILIALVVMRMGQRPEHGIDRISYALLDPKSADRVEFSGKNTLQLRKDGEVWKTEKNKNADSEMITRLLEALPKLNSSTQITRSKDRYDDFEVSDEKGTRLKVFANNRLLADLVIGKANPSGGMYARVGEAVYAVTGQYPGTFVREASAWLERRLFRDKLENVTRVEIALAGQPSYVLVKEGDDFKVEDAKILPKNFRFDKNAARSLVSQIVSARAKDVLDNDPGADKTQIETGDRLIFKVREPSKPEIIYDRELRLGGNLGDKSIYAKVVGQPDIYTLPEYLAKSLRKGVSDLRDFGMMQLDTSKVEELSIQDEKSRLLLRKTQNGWQIANATPAAPKDFKFDGTAVDRRLAALAQAKGLKLATINATEAGLNNSSTKITAKLSDGQGVTLTFGKSLKDENRDAVYAKGNADAEVYVTASWTKTNLLGGIDTFKERPQPTGNNFSNIDPNALQQLPPDVRQSLMQQMQQKRMQEQLMRQVEAKNKPAK